MALILQVCQWDHLLSTLFRLSFDPDVLLSVSSLVALSFREFDSFNATQAIVVTWENVAPYTDSLKEMVSSDHAVIVMLTNYL